MKINYAFKVERSFFWLRLCTFVNILMNYFFAVLCRSAITKKEPYHFNYTFYERKTFGDFLNPA